MYRFVLRPRWIAGHLVVVLAIVVMVNLGFWQLRRLDERRAYNERVEDRTAEPIASVAEVAAGDVDDHEFRRIRVRGRFDGSDDVLIGYRSFDGISGHHVVSPLVRSDGTAVLVNRGWVPARYAEEWPVADAAPPRHEVEVVGFVRATETRGSFGPRDPEGGDLPLVSRVDVARIGRQVDADVHPFWIQMAAPEPADGIPAPVPLPDLGEGNHLSYAVQWFLFSVGAVIGWPILVRVSARRQALARAAPSRENDAASAPASAPTTPSTSI